MSTGAAATLLGLFLSFVGVTHFLWPRYYVRLVPAWIPRARAVVFASGMAEVVTGGLVLWPETQLIGAWVAAGLITGYLSSHFDALLRSRNVPWNDPLFGLPAAVVRILVNLLYIFWAVHVATSA